VENGGYWVQSPRHTHETAAGSAVESWRSESTRLPLLLTSSAPRHPDALTLRDLPIIATRTDRNGRFTFRHLTEGVYVPVVMLSSAVGSLDVESSRAGRLECRKSAGGRSVLGPQRAAALDGTGKVSVREQQFPGYVMLTEKVRCADIGTANVLAGEGVKIVGSATEEE